jgi:hypothetical protein
MAANAMGTGGARRGDGEVHALNLKWRGQTDDTVLPMVRVTRYGPTRLTPFSRRVSLASIWFGVEAPPEPAMLRSGLKPAPGQTGISCACSHERAGG